METGFATAPERLRLRRWIRRLAVAAGLLVVGAAITWWNSPWIARRLHRLSPHVLYYVDTADSLVALTLDDGPSRSTARILDVLERLVLSGELAWSYVAAGSVAPGGEPAADDSFLR